MLLSVVICTYNREEFIIKSVEALVDQTASKDQYEVIVVNNNSSDSTEQLCLDFKNTNNKINFVYYVEKKQGLSAARNAGIKLARGEYISFVDDDGLAEKDYVENIIKAFQKYPDYISLGGKVLPVFPNNIEPEWMSKHIEGIVSKVDLGNFFIPFTKKYPVGCNMAFRSNFFEQYGGFNTDLTARGDDKYIFLKLKTNNEKVLYAPNVVVHHFMEPFRFSREYLLKQSFQIGESERLRLYPSTSALLKKFVEYLFKFSASVALYLYYLLFSKPKKGKYIILIMWNTLKGFMKSWINK
jgi:glycosyltransferase involved in cell wall biosynthesis